MESRSVRTTRRRRVPTRPYDSRRRSRSQAPAEGTVGAHALERGGEGAGGGGPAGAGRAGEEPGVRHASRI